ncbi:hypothetical protein SLNWT_6593 [Streptomyces albus]|uniref:Uncharacterized protein n=1 Tax=Streptomyces albus (strain ATCC 21838 / DSM 41398 / FERM P-419 / JCM 4703 / NBRC 107858) TaxID=1081613 RepID=A0A0B5EYW1_STRA4|nr:hypothetical protein SLNWT_6593 [Streptomyces albus]AOU81273.1 hypothetical protein SLNHY_6582 [Streptomyces albus]AYN36968.1 hypothetical protein DUI70_6474 [Streptomyces albus]
MVSGRRADCRGGALQPASGHQADSRAPDRPPTAGQATGRR